MIIQSQGALDSQYVIETEDTSQPAEEREVLFPFMFTVEISNRLNVWITINSNRLDLEWRWQTDNKLATQTKWRWIQCIF